MTYRIDIDRRCLETSDAQAVLLKAGPGPRHLVFHPDGVTAYVVDELDSTFCRVAYSPARGTRRLIETVDALPKDAGAGQPADLQIAATRAFYASIRGADVIGI